MAPCNCSKNRTAQATGFARPGREAQAAQRDGAKAQSIEFTAPSGEKKVVGSRLEASAARVRAGGGTIRPL